MKLYSTNDPTLRVDLKEAIFKGLPDDNGLFMPLEIPRMPASFFSEDVYDMSFQESSFALAKHLLQGAIPDADLQSILEHALDFPAPLVQLDQQTHVLELFHGPSLAFKDFGARFMAQTMSWFNRGENQDLVILVATSGDTGGAVAAGFYNTPGIRVIILYPSGKVSLLQEKQLTALGGNVTALEVAGTFDDCQALVKQAFLDKSLTSRFRLSSANSINIARLIPQSFYYVEAYKQLPKGSKVVFSVPSGNFGNLTAGLLAHKMGLPVHHFLAATNINDVVPAYLASGVYQSRPSERTLSNAMDVGNPSNFARMLDLYGSTWNTMRSEISGYSYTDAETEVAMRDIWEEFGYVIDPHGAVAYLALRAYQANNPGTQGVVLETAHPAKFLDDVNRVLGFEVEVPERLAKLANEIKVATQMSTDYNDFKVWLTDNLV
jgi:threonine synthase